MPGINEQDIKDKVFSWPSWSPEMPKFNLFTQKTPVPKQDPAMSKAMERASEFVSILRSKGPRAAYAQFGDINSLFDSAVGFGLINPGERESIWAAFNAPEGEASLERTGTGSGSAPSSTPGEIDILRSTSPRHSGAPRESGSVGGEITPELIARAGGTLNAYDNAWRDGWMVEPKREHFKDRKTYMDYFTRWRNSH